MTLKTPDLLTPIELLRRHSLASAAQEEIERLILSGEYTSGDKLLEIDLATRLGVSRGPVREAFRGLEEAGLVRFERNRGVFVRKIEIEEADQNYVVRAALEELAGRLIAPTITNDRVKALRAILKRMEMAVERNEAAACANLNFEFHLALMDLTENGKLIEIYQKITKELMLFRKVSHAPVMSVSEHHEIVDALAAHDGEAAGRAMRDHVEAGRRRMRAAFGAS